MAKATRKQALGRGLSALLKDPRIKMPTRLLVILSNLILIALKSIHFNQELILMKNHYES
jgi:hypothetical protein